MAFKFLRLLFLCGNFIVCKIELGGLVIKARMDGFNKSVILGALNYVMQLIDKDDSYLSLFETKGNNLFLN